MAMSRSFGATLFTTRPPMRISPAEISSSPAIMRSSVDLPQPDGPTSTQNSPSAIDTSTPCTTWVEPNDLRTALRSTAAMGGLVYLGLGRRRGAFEEVEVAAFIGLLHVLREDGAVAALVFPCRRFPGAFSFLQFLVGHFQIQLPFFHIELDQVAILHQRQRPADIGLRRDVQYAAAVARAAHARVGNAHHVAHAVL